MIDCEDEILKIYSVENIKLISNKQKINNLS